MQIFFGLGSSLSALEGLLLIETVGWQWYSAIAVVTPALVLLALLVVSHASKIIAGCYKWLLSVYSRDTKVPVCAWKTERSTGATDQNGSI